MLERDRRYRNFFTDLKGKKNRIANKWGKNLEKPPPRCRDSTLVVDHWCKHSNSLFTRTAFNRRHNRPREAWCWFSKRLSVTAAAMDTNMNSIPEEFGTLYVTKPGNGPLSRMSVPLVTSTCTKKNNYVETVPQGSDDHDQEVEE